MSEPLPSPVSAPADLAHVETWVFDLDHTLYTVSDAQNARMGARIGEYVQGFLGLSPEEAHALQKRYLNDYGSTLAGLWRHHGVDPDAYHAFVNDIAALDLAHNARLRSGLERLPGSRIIFTNNCGRYAADVLADIGIADLFDDIIDAKALGFVPKPNPPAYEKLLALGAKPGRAAMFDDSARNLKPAHELGLTTVWCLTGPAEWRPAAGEHHSHIDHTTADLADFLLEIGLRA